MTGIARALGWARARPARCVDVAGLTACGAWTWLASASWQEVHVPVAGLLAVVAVAWLATLAAWAVARAGGVGVRRVVAWAVVFRAIGFAGEPILEDDHYRYLWDGRSFAVTGNPYADAPSDHFADPDLPEPYQVILDNLNHPTLPTIYGPVCQVVFLAAYWIAPGELFALKGILVALDLIAVALMATLTGPASLLLYAWCPLLVQEVAFTAHIDIVGVLLLVGALAAFQRRRDATVGCLLALALGVKPFAMIAAPVLLLRTRWGASLAFGGTLALLHAPFLVVWKGGGEALLAFLDEWEFNSTGFAVAQMLLGPSGARLACVHLFLAVYMAFLSLEVRGPARRTPRLAPLFGFFFLLAPVVNPWYLLWMLPAVALRPSAWSVTALAVVPLAYVHGLSLPGAGLSPWEHPFWVRPLELGAVLLAACAGWWGSARGAEAEGDGEGRADDVLASRVPTIERVCVE